MHNELSREAILELFACRCEEYGWPAGDHEDDCCRHVIDWLLEELAKPREERRDYYGRALG